MLFLTDPDITPIVVAGPALLRSEACVHKKAETDRPGDRSNQAVLNREWQRFG